jgi:hypothetical protein
MKITKQVSMMNEDFVQLNVNEISIILSALQNLDVRDEKLVGNASALYNKLYTVSEQLDRNQKVSNLAGRMPV